MHRYQSYSPRREKGESKACIIDVPFDFGDTQNDCFYRDNVQNVVTPPLLLENANLYILYSKVHVFF